MNSCISTKIPKMEIGRKRDKVSLYSPAWPGSHHFDQAELKLRESLLFVFWVQSLMVCAITPSDYTIFTDVMRRTKNQEGIDDVAKLTKAIESGRETKSVGFQLQWFSHVFVQFLCKTSIHNTQCTLPLPIKWLSKETRHYLSHILRFGAHVLFQHKKLIPYPATFNTLERGSSPWEMDNIFPWLCG